MHFLRCYPRLTDFIYENIYSGIDLRFLPIHSYGFFVACGFFAAALVATSEMKRREKLGLFSYQEKEIMVGEGPTLLDTLLYVLFGFLLGFKVLGISNFYEQLHTGQMSFRHFMMADGDANFIFRLLKYGNWIGGIFGGIGLGLWFYYSKLKEKLPQPIKQMLRIYPSDRIGDLVVIAAILGVLGANFFNYLESPDDYSNFMQDPIGSLFSGLSVFGGLICAGIGFAIFAWWNKINVLMLFDSVAPGFILANGIGRIGCHVAGDGDWGVANNLPKPALIPEFLWRNNYAHNIINDGVPIPGCVGEYCSVLPHMVFPTPLYELIMCTAICIILLSLKRWFTYMPGMVFCVFMILIGIQRFTIEQFREVGGRNLIPFLGFHLKQAEIISIILFLIGIASSVGLYLYYKKKPLAVST